MAFDYFQVAEMGSVQLSRLKGSFSQVGYDPKDGWVIKGRDVGELTSFSISEGGKTFCVPIMKLED